MTDRPEDDQKGTPPSTPADTTAKAPAPTQGSDEFELDLEVGDIQTRLPYGSEDIADK